MKAKFIAANDKFEIRLENGTIFTSNKGENSKDFTKRVKEAAALDVGDLTITELTIAAFSKLSVEQLTAAKAKESGLLAELIQSAIDGRMPTDGTASNTAKANIAAIDANKAAKEIAEKEAKKADREKAKAEKPTLESVITAAVEAKKNVGHTVKFCPHRTAMKTDGIVNGVWVDKRVPMALYRIFDADGVMYNKIIDAPDLQFGELAPNPKAAEKEEKAKAKVEAAETKKAEKEANDKTKAEAKEKAAADKVIAIQQKAAAKVEAAQKKAEEAAAKLVEKAEALKAKQEAAAKVLAAAIQTQVDAPSKANGMPKITSK